MICQHFLHLSQPCFSVVCEGWTQVAGPNGWVQLISGPRIGRVRRRMESLYNNHGSLGTTDRLLQPRTVFPKNRRHVFMHPDERISVSSAMDISTSNVAAEMKQLQTRTAQMQAQNEELLSSSKRQASASKERGRRLREDFVFSCDEEVAQCASRQARRNFSRERARVGTVVPNCGQCKKGEPSVQEFSPVHGRERDQLRCTIQSVASEDTCVLRISKYGLRGCRREDPSPCEGTPPSGVKFETFGK